MWSELSKQVFEDIFVTHNSKELMTSKLNFFILSGYMSPEYAIDGVFSEKSDVFSFGVIVLEIVSGRRSRGFYQLNNENNLLNYVSLRTNNIRSTFEIAKTL